MKYPKLPLMGLLLSMLLLLGGCNTMLETAIGQTPSAKYCDRVSYERLGNRVEIRVECVAPSGKSPSILPDLIPGGL